MDTRQAHAIVRDAFLLGMISYRQMIRPASDKVKQREAWRYLEDQGLPRRLLTEWVENGIVRRHKDNAKGANATVWYRLTEIQKAIVALRTAEAME